jgi:hypothetical protein
MVECEARGERGPVCGLPPTERHRAIMLATIITHAAWAASSGGVSEEFGRLATAQAVKHALLKACAEPSIGRRLRAGLKAGALDTADAIKEVLFGT